MEAWDKPDSLPDKIAHAKALAKITVSLLQTRFNSIGSLHPSDDGQIVVGPMIAPCEPNLFTRDGDLPRGPWRTHREYLLACVSREYDWTVANAATVDSHWIGHDPAILGEKTIHEGYLSLYSRIREHVVHHTDLDRPLPDNLGPFVLRHVDMSMSNVLVDEQDPSRLTVIDWEAARTAPFCVVAELPQFLTIPRPDTDEIEAIKSFLDECSALMPDVFAGERDRARQGSLSNLEVMCQLRSTAVALDEFKPVLDDVLSSCN